VLFAFSLYLALTSLAGPAEEQAAAQRLDEIERAYTMTPSDRVEADALALAARMPETTAAGRALVWLGALALQHHQPARAASRFREARRRFPHGEIGALAARGLGDVALTERRWSEAIARYDEARLDASPLLAHELDDKRTIAVRERGRTRFEVACWIVYALALGWFARAVRRWRRAVPVETRFLLPVDAILLAACWGRDPRVWTAMLWITLGSLVLVTAGFADPRPRSHAALDVCAFVLGTAAMIFVGLHHGGALDALRSSVPL
jgi:hypothetical protein